MALQTLIQFGELNLVNPALTNLDGLEAISTTERLMIVFNNNLSNLNGLANLSSVDSILEIDSNPSLTNLDGLSGLISIGGHLWIGNNASLYSFCGIYTLLNNDGLVGDYLITGNAVDPTQQQIIDGGPCSNVYLGDIILYNQTDVDAFNYNFVSGNLEIKVMILLISVHFPHSHLLVETCFFSLLPRCQMLTVYQI